MSKTLLITRSLKRTNKDKKNQKIKPKLNKTLLNRKTLKKKDLIMRSKAVNKSSKILRNNLLTCKGLPMKKKPKLNKTNKPSKMRKKILSINSWAKLMITA